MNEKIVIDQDKFNRIKNAVYLLEKAALTDKRINEKKIVDMHKKKIEEIVNAYKED